MVFGCVITFETLLFLIFLRNVIGFEKSSEYNCLSVFITLTHFKNKLIFVFDINEIPFPSPNILVNDLSDFF